MALRRYIVASDPISIVVPDRPAHKPIELYEGDTLLYDEVHYVARIGEEQYHLPKISSAIKAGWLVLEEEEK